MRTTSPQPGIAAAYPGVCPVCDQHYGQGDRVVHQRGAYIHCHCAPGADDA